MAADFLDILEENGIKGRGGAGFPAKQKWQAVASTLSREHNVSYYIVINAAESEPGVTKDLFIMEHAFAEVLIGLKAGIAFLGEKRLAGIHCFTSKEHYRAAHAIIDKLLRQPRFMSLSVFWRWQIKPARIGYVGGEETVILNHLEGRRCEPRLRIVPVTDIGLGRHPALVSNVETLHAIGLAVSGRYEKRRFYSISGDAPRPGVYYLPEDLDIEEILRFTGNWPTFKFFVQSGGGATGEVLNPLQLGRPVSGSGGIVVYAWHKHNREERLKYWLDFFADASCGQCVPCREGMYRLKELSLAGKAYSPEFWDILEALRASSFCGLGRGAALTLSSYYENILSNKKL